MRMDYKKNMAHRNKQDVFGVELHDFLVKEATLTEVELAGELGISVGSVRKLKKQIR
ncbi:hypothetical protein SAMN05877753_105335 [Bacillus oleivorans]|uniref:Uncharacterized protein n=1 Tax=Bacillus oleivorans TaxID=1448271 RepID=A0A285CXK2_9BACI|nr:hypothetical protein [Bacillus oleivorans]SNX71673.1 hypothetical protein SAMN05877753_105335 [Bacillus oleivorans]